MFYQIFTSYIQQLNVGATYERIIFPLATRTKMFKNHMMCPLRIILLRDKNKYFFSLMTGICVMIRKVLCLEKLLRKLNKVSLNNESKFQLADKSFALHLWAC